MKIKQRYDLYSVVELSKDIPSEGLKAGSIGTIVLVHEMPEAAYEVEFTDGSGRTTAEVALTDEDIKLHAG